MNGLLIILLCLMGLCWGSFLNVLIIRTLSGESIIFPPSKCPKCSHSLYWWQNIPIISFYLLKGKCYFCNKTISIQYPIVEVAGLGIFLFAFWTNVSIVDAIAVVLILSMFLVMSYTDIVKQKISPQQAIVVILSGILFSRYDILNSVVGACAGAGFILLCMIIGNKLFNKKTFGVGDIYLLSAMGAVVGLKSLGLFMFVALFIQFLCVFPRYITSLIRNEQVETLRYFIIFGFTCFFLNVLKKVSFIGSKTVTVLVLCVLLFYSFKLMRNIFNTLKERETPSTCPLAPAIAISCLIFLC